MPPADVLKPLQTEFPVAEVAGLGESIRAEEKGVSRLELRCEFLVRDIGKKTGRDAWNLQGLAPLLAKKQWPGHSSSDNAHFSHIGIEHRVLNRTVVPRNAPEEKLFVKQVEYAGGCQARLVDAAASANR